MDELENNEKEERERAQHSITWHTSIRIDFLLLLFLLGDAVFTVDQDPIDGVILLHKVDNLVGVRLLSGSAVAAALLKVAGQNACITPYKK